VSAGAEDQPPSADCETPSSSPISPERPSSSRRTSAAPLRRRDPLQGADELVDRRAVVLLHGRDVAVELDLERPRLLPPKRCRIRLWGSGSASLAYAASRRAERAQRVDERRPGHVLSVGAVAEQGERVAEDPAAWRR
jgi:hypothetical protein